MVHAIIQQGRVEVQTPIPSDWEGQTVKIVPLTPDDPLPDLDIRLAQLHAMGPMEFEPGEREAIALALEEMDRLGRDQMRKL
jgi:hypothetical protein